MKLVVREESMPKPPIHRLIWSAESSSYTLFTPDQPPRSLVPGDEESWLAWLTTHTSFSFQGQHGQLSVLKESRSRGAGYWYAYHTAENQSRKRYLGRTSTVTLARLEEVAHTLNREASSVSSLPAHAQGERDSVSGDALLVPPGEMFHEVELLFTKLSHPLLPSRILTRERLLHRLDAARFHRLTLLSASAGWGKTTLLSAWASRATLPIAWLSLDELDNAPARFWVAVIAALRTCLPGVGEAALTMLRSPQPRPLTAILTTLLNELREQDTPVFLLLDDYHLIDEQTIHDSLLFVLDHLPAHLHLVVSSRIDPELSLSRWRARGQLLELRDADLRFQGEEAAQFLTHTMDLSLEVKEMADLTQRTEGWIAGLQLAALALRQRRDQTDFVQGFAGSHRYVLDYVQDEILARLPVPLRDFLLHTSILSRMSASLCQAVTTELESQKLLETMERTNLFVVPLDEERRWYRMHDLFREALLTRLHAIEPALEPLLHQRAARWYEEQGEWHEAISHALRAQDFLFAVHLMEQVAAQLRLRGESEIFYHWVMALPEHILREHAGFALTLAQYLLNSSASTPQAQQIRIQTQVEQMARRVEMAAQQEACTASHPRNHASEQTLLHRRLCLLRLQCKWAKELIVGSDHELIGSLNQQIQLLDEEDEVVWQMIPLTTTFIYHYTFRQEGAILLPRLLAAKQWASQSGDHFATLKIMQWLALASVEAGQLHQARQEVLTGLELLEQFNGYALLAGYFYVALELVLYEWNRLEEARRVLRKMIHDAETYQQIDLQQSGYRYLLIVELADGNLDAAYQVLQEWEQLVLQGAFTLHRHWLENTRVLYWLAQGDLSKASDWASTLSFPQEGWNPHLYDAFVSLIRVSFARQQWRYALEMLERFSAYFDRPGILSWTTTWFLSFYAVALYQTGKMEQARAVAIRLLALTEPEGYLRTYLDVGEPMRQLLQSLLQGPVESEQQSMSAAVRSYITTLLKAFEQGQQRQVQRVEASSTQADQPRPLPDGVDP